MTEICPPESDFEQTLFLGCSVQSFSCSLGFNEQPTTVNVTLVRDECPGGTRVYYTPEKQTTTSADPGFRIYGDSGLEPPEIGAPVFFKYADFEFCGLIQTWQQIEPGSDTEVYQVTIASPVELLQGTTCILDDYAGQVKGFNVFNVYGFQEYSWGNPGTTFTQNAADGVLFGSVALGFGGADATEAGMPWRKVRDGISILTSALPKVNSGPIEQFSQYGRICFIGAARGGYGLIANDGINVVAGGLFAYAKYVSEYYLDLSDLPLSTVDIRIPGPTADILTIVSQICQEMGFDYYIELIPTYINGLLSKIIKIRPISRQSQPNLGAVENYVAALTNNGLIASSYGRELRNESTTNFVIGGQKRTIYQVTNGVPLPGVDPDVTWLDANYPSNPYVRDTMVPYYGTDYYGNVLVPTTGGEIIMRSDGLKQSLTAIGGSMGNYIKISLDEIDYAGAGFSSFTQALSIGKQTPDRLGYIIAQYDPTFRPESRAKDLGVQLNQKVKARDLIQTINIKYDDEISRDIQKIYEFVLNLYNNSQSKIMVRLPYVNAKRILTTEGSESELLNGRLITSDTPCEGGWTETSNVIGLANPGGIIDYFKNDDGSIHSFGNFLFASGLKLDQVDDNLKYYFHEVPPSGSNNFIFYTEVQTNPDLVFLDNTKAISPRVIVDIPNLNAASSYDKDDNFNETAIKLDFKIQAGISLTKDEEKELARTNFRKRILEPYQLALAFESNENTYGPWKPSNVIEAGPPGRINVIKDESLVPWTYGSYANMNTIAQARADEGVGGMQAAENGSITVDGYPTILLGSELSYSSIQDLFDQTTAEQSTINIVTEFASYSYNIPYIARSVWTGSYGPNVNSINVQFGTGGITTTYEFRTFSPRFGTLSKYNANQLSQRLIKENKLNSKIRFLNNVNSLQAANTKRLAPLGIKTKGGKVAQEEESANDEASQVPSNSVLVGGHAPFRKDSDPEETPTQKTERDRKGRRRSIITAKPLSKLGEECSNSGYDNKSYMSWDGFMRPVSLGGSGGLPRMIQAQETGVYDTGTSATNTITNKYLNFLANPTGYDFDELSFLHTGLDSGHDIEVVGRSTYNDLVNLTTGYTGTGEHSPSLVNPTNTVEGNVVDGYDNDYRFMALRGPLFLQSWGYDTDGKPVPNEADSFEVSGVTGIESGVFATTGLTNRFYPDWLKKPQTWPVAPIDIRLNRERGVWEAGTGSGGGGSASEMVMVLDDLPGYTIKDMVGTPTKVRVIKRYWSGDLLGVDSAGEIFEAYAAEPNIINLDDDTCCNSTSTGTVVPGLNLVTPINGDNSVDDNTLSNVQILGNGVQDSSEVVLSVSNVGSFNSDDPDNDFEIINNSFSLNVSLSTVPTTTHISPGGRAVYNGVCRISATETLIGGIVQEARNVVINVRKNYNTEASSWVNGATHAIPPKLGPGMDTGRSSSDNWTAVTAPLVYFQCSSSLAGAGDHWIATYIDGVFNNIYSSIDNEESGYAIGPGYTYAITMPTLSEGIHSIQFFEMNGNNPNTTAMWGPMSNPLWLIIDADETGTPPDESFELSDIRYGRHGYIETIENKKMLTKIGSCPIKLTSLLSDRVNDYITGTGRAASDFGPADSSVGIASGTWAINNPTTGTNPASPTSLLLHSNFSGAANDIINARYKNGAWEMRGVKSV